MAQEIELNPVTHITVDAIGQPGKRVFYIQGQKDARTITLIMEKFQVQSLAVHVEQFMAELQQKFPHLAEASSEYNEVNMRIQPPVDPLFRVSEMSLAYDNSLDMVVIAANEMMPETGEEETTEKSAEEDAEGRIVRFWCSRSQCRAMAHWGMEVVGRGRPLCTQCGAPIDPEEGHFCPKKNGHRK